MSYEDKFALSEAAGEDGVYARIDETHPVGIFLGLEDGQRTIMIVCSKRPPDPPSLAAIDVEARSRQDGDWVLVLRLLRSDLKSLFTRLVEDLDLATRQRPDDPGEVVVGRLVRWQRLLSQGRLGMLEDHELRGLAAELDFLLAEAIPAVGVRAAVSAWTGALDTPKDFVFDNREVEIKAVHQQPRVVSISSLEQLTDAGLPLYLWCRVVELGNAPPGGANSVAEFIRRVREAVVQDAAAAEQLDTKLVAAGYEDLPEYLARSVRFGAVSCFHVTGAFPRIQKPEVAAAVVGCKYDLGFADLDPFRVATWRE